MTAVVYLIVWCPILLVCLLSKIGKAPGPNICSGDRYAAFPSKNSSHFHLSLTMAPRILIVGKPFLTLYPTHPLYNARF